MGATLEEQGINRRTFYLSAIYGLWALIGAALAVPAGIYLLFPPRPRKGPEWVKAIDLTELQPGAPEEIVFRRNRADGWKITSEKATAWVVKMSDKEIIAFGPQCPHLGCAYHWDQKNKEFLCPCHASTFSIDGKVLAGPAPRPLDRYEAKIEGKSLLLGPVHKSEGIS
jgi:menaquinol-cytochrome c reductase iron-sulfur subunit